MPEWRAFRTSGASSTWCPGARWIVAGPGWRGAAATAVRSDDPWRPRGCAQNSASGGLPRGGRRRSAPRASIAARHGQSERRQAAAAACADDAGGDDEALAAEPPAAEPACMPGWDAQQHAWNSKLRWSPQFHFVEESTNNVDIVVNRLAANHLCSRQHVYGLCPAAPVVRGQRVAKRDGNASKVSVQNHSWYGSHSARVPAAAIKWAVLGFTRAAQYWRGQGPPIRVAAVCPTLVLTEGAFSIDGQTRINVDLWCFGNEKRMNWPGGILSDKASADLVF